MKYLIPAFSIVFLFSCGDVEDNPEYQQMKKENELLKSEASESGAAIDSFIMSFNEIQANLDTIKAKEDIITIQTQRSMENPVEKSELIKEDIQLIYNLMEENRQELAKLKEQLKNSKGQAAKLSVVIENLEKEIQRKDEEIDNLRMELANMNIIVETLVADVDKLAIESEEKSQLINAQRNEMNTAFYAIDEEKALKNKGIITEEGGFIGIGKAEKLADDINDEDFTEIDILKRKAFAIGTKKAELVTSHPSSSYEWKGKNPIDSLIIKDPYEFWKTSNYLVVIKD